jgi:hypothetical protein
MPLFVFDPLADPGVADVMVAAGMQSPGVCLLMSGGDREYNWDIKQAPGTQGYTMTYRGWKAGDPIVMRFVFFEHPKGPGYTVTFPSSQVESFYNDWVPIFAIDARKLRPNPIAINHPILASNDINNVVCKKIGALQHDGKMLWWVDMTFLEFRPPRLIPAATPKGATDRLGVPTPQTKIQREIAAELELSKRPL